MYGVSLLDLRSQMNITYEQAGRALATRAIGNFFGALIGGFIHEVGRTLQSRYLRVMFYKS